MQGAFSRRARWLKKHSIVRKEYKNSNSRYSSANSKETLEEESEKLGKSFLRLDVDLKSGQNGLKKKGTHKNMRLRGRRPGLKLCELGKEYLEL